MSALQAADAPAASQLVQKCFWLLGGTHPKVGRQGGRGLRCRCSVTEDTLYAHVDCTICSDSNKNIKVAQLIKDVQSKHVIKFIVQVTSNQVMGNSLCSEVRIGLFVRA